MKLQITYRNLPSLPTLWLTVAILIPQPVHSQVEIAPKVPSGISKFYVDALSFSGDSLGSRLDVYIQVPFEAITFLKEANHFEAKYEVTIALTSSDDKIVTEKNWTEVVKVGTFEETVAGKASSTVVRSFPLEPGKYKFLTRVRDSDSKQSGRFEADLQVPNLRAARVGLSDIMLVRQLTEKEGKKDIVPNITGNVGDSPEGFYLFFELYNHSNLDTMELNYTISNPKNKKFKPITRIAREPATAARTQVFYKVDSISLPVGNYLLTVDARKPLRGGDSDREKGELLATTKRVFSSRWEGAPMSITDLDVAVEQMRFIAKDDDLSYIKDAPNMEEKQKRFVDYWKKRDPTPGTPQNELMEEYYGRIQYSNEHFSHYMEGWKTDMGLVYILWGAPNNVERHPFEYDSKPYEIWSYYVENRQFIFLDQTGFGDYRLITPLSEVWQRR